MKSNCSIMIDVFLLLNSQTQQIAHDCQYNYLYINHMETIKHDSFCEFTDPYDVLICCATLKKQCRRQSGTNSWEEYRFSINSKSYNKNYYYELLQLRFCNLTIVKTLNDNLLYTTTGSYNLLSQYSFQ